MDPVAFLRAQPPFDRLEPEAMKRLQDGLEIAYQPKDARILQRGGPPNRFLYVIRKGTVRLERDGELVQVLEEGECFGFPSLIAKTNPTADVVAAEDTLLYQVPGDIFDRLMKQPAFAEFFLVDLSERLRRTAARRPLPLGQELATPVGRLPVSPPVHVPATITVGEAARTMREKGISSVLVDGDPPGILTDRDLRSRVLAEGRGPETLVADVATRPLRTVSASATLFETLLFMLEQHVHHAPLETDGAIVGIVTDTDLLRLYAKNPLYLLRNIERVEAPADLNRYGSELAAMVETMVWGGVSPAQIGPVVSRLNDAVVARLLRLVERELGPPPVPYAWIVFGSEGRTEQTLLTDQDNAIVWADVDGRTRVLPHRDHAGHADTSDDALPHQDHTGRAEGSGDPHAYFRALAERVTHGLIGAGFPPCPGGFMATNWQRPLAEWLKLFKGWVAAPDPRALIEAMNFFDFRAVHGSLGLDALEQVLRQARHEEVFLAHFARASLGLTPPLGAFRQIRSVESGVDLKKGGLAPIVSLARLYAFEAGSAARPTLDRLHAGAEAGTLSRHGADTLSEGFRFLLGLRLREQLRALRAGETVGNSVKLENLSGVEQRHLKEVFLAIREVQHATAIRYEVQRLA
jgi:CBS domain-containing protein